MGERGGCLESCRAILRSSNLTIRFMNSKLPANPLKEGLRNFVWAPTFTLVHTIKRSEVLDRVDVICAWCAEGRRWIPAVPDMEEICSRGSSTYCIYCMSLLIRINGDGGEGTGASDTAASCYSVFEGSASGVSAGSLGTARRETRCWYNSGAVE